MKSVCMFFMLAAVAACVHAAPDATDVYRRVLSAQPDGSVTVCTVGFLTNLRRLLQSPPDCHLQN